jgi:manganese-dependent inorganic pyrophosphatase
MTVDNTQRNDNERVYVIGHRNPDTDSICSAICYAALKHKVDGNEYIAARAGDVNNETAFVLDYFGVEAPKLITNITTQVRDIEIRKTKGVDKSFSIKKAWKMMQENDVVTIPIVTETGDLEGLITVADIAHNIMDVYDNGILATARTLYSNILDTIDGEMIIGSVDDVCDEGKVLIAAANPDMMESYIEKNDIVIVGNRYESQLCAIEMEAGCIIVCEGSPVSKTIRKLATSRGCRIISTPYDAFTVASLINQSISIGYFMKRHNLTVFDVTDYIDEVSDVMKTKRYRDFPILGDDGKYLGMISRRNLLGAKGKKVILVDHNERNQCVDGIEHAEIQEIIDHHRIGAVETISPVFFRNQPLGCTSTIIYQMYKEAGVGFDKVTAGLLCSAIISDTLMFRSPTSTEFDRTAVNELAPIAGIDMESFAEQMFSAAGDLEDKPADEIFYQDFKRFNAEDISFGVGQVVSLNKNELQALKKKMLPFLKEAQQAHKVNMMFFMLTNVLTEVTGLLCEGEGARELILHAFEGIAVVEDDDPTLIRLPDVMSRKKQLVPRIITALQEREAGVL